MFFNFYYFQKTNTGTVVGNIKLSRRSLLQLIVKLPLVSGLVFLLRNPAATAAQESQYVLSDLQQDCLRRLCYLLFPYPGLGSAPYERVVAVLSNRISVDTKLPPLLLNGLKQLNVLVAPGNFLDVDEEDQLDAMWRIERSEFFQWLLAATKEQLFNDKAVWDYIGYEGSSLEFGGYRQRGLNDIDWLGN